MVKTTLKQIGDSYFVLVPKTLVDVFELDSYKFKVSITNDKSINFQNIGKINDKEQTTLDELKNED